MSPETTQPRCDWCGHAHAVTALCSQAPRARGMSRRSFLFLGATAAVGALVAPIELLAPRAVVEEWMHVAGVSEHAKAFTFTFDLQAVINSSLSNFNLAEIAR